jgi:uncharacterized protein involved in exopolysaccharide biosynthesis
MSSFNASNGHSQADTFDVRASLRNIADAARHERKLVLFTCALTLALVIVYILVWPPVYTATAMLMVERDTDPVRDSFYLGWNVFRKDDARTEIELMTAGPVLKEVIERQNLGYDDVYHPFASHLTRIWETSFVGRTYRAAKRKLLGAEEGGLTPSDEELARTIIDLRAGISIDPVAESNVGRLTAKGPSRRVAEIANTLVDVYLERRSERHLAEARRSHEILSDQVSRAEAELIAIERRRLEFTQQNTLAFDFHKESLEVEKLTNLEESIRTTRSTIASLEASLAELEEQIAREPETRTTATVFEINSVREAAKLKRLELETALIAARNRFREDSPEIQEILEDIVELDVLVAESDEKIEKASTEGLNTHRQDMISKRNGIRQELKGARAGLAVMEGSAVELRNRLGQVPALQAALRTLDREYALSQEKYKELISKQAQAAVSVATAPAAMPSMRVVEYAVPPAKKSWPRAKLLFPAALVVGLTLGVGAAVVVSYASGRVRREHLEHGRGSAPLYGTLGVSLEGIPLAVVSRRGDAEPGSRPTES